MKKETRLLFKNKQGKGKKPIKTEIMDDEKKRMKSNIMKLVGHIVNLQKRVSTLEAGSSPYDQAEATSAPSVTSTTYDQAEVTSASSATSTTSVMDAAVPNITAQEAAVAAETIMKLKQTELNEETTRTEAETCTETRALAQAYFQAT